MRLVLAVAAGYVLGSVPFGLLLTRAAGLGDIRTIGSGNIGATNVLRTGHRGLAAATLLLDALKGAAALLGASALAGPDAGRAAGVAAVLGHLFPPWLGFRGGKGVATGLGVLFAASWPTGLAAAATWLVVARLFRISSLGALSAFLVAPALAFSLAGPRTGAAILVIAGLVFFRHGDNIRRLLTGTEPRVGHAP